MRKQKTKSKIFVNSEYTELFEYRLQGKKKNYAVWYKMKPKLKEFVFLADKYLEKIRELLEEK